MSVDILRDNWSLAALVVELLVLAVVAGVIFCDAPVRWALGYFLPAVSICLYMAWVERFDVYSDGFAHACWVMSMFVPVTLSGAFVGGRIRRGPGRSTGAV
jgi:hypothetical protein